MLHRVDRAGISATSVCCTARLSNDNADSFCSRTEAGPRLTGKFAYLQGRASLQQTGHEPFQLLARLFSKKAEG